MLRVFRRSCWGVIQPQRVNKTHRIIPVPCVGRFPRLGYRVCAPPAACQPWVVQAEGRCVGVPLPFQVVVALHAVVAVAVRAMSMNMRAPGAPKLVLQCLDGRLVRQFLDCILMGLFDRAQFLANTMQIMSECGGELFARLADFTNNFRMCHRCFGFRLLIIIQKGCK